MRIIKFRGWNIEEARMIQNIQLEYDGFIDGEDTFAQYIGQESGYTRSGEKGKYKVMQYTGLKDVDGKEIYEGDIMSGGYEIRFREHKFKNFMNGDLSESRTHLGFYAYQKAYISNIDNQKVNYGNEYKAASDFPKLKVIGNIYQNPELLENK